MQLLPTVHKKVGFSQVQGQLLDKLMRSGQETSRQLATLRAVVDKSTPAVPSAEHCTAHASEVNTSAAAYARARPHHCVHLQPAHSVVVIVCASQRSRRSVSAQKHHLCQLDPIAGTKRPSRRATRCRQQQQGSQPSLECTKPPSANSTGWGWTG